MRRRRAAVRAVFMREYLFNTEKIKYIKGARPDVGCILCAIRDRNPEVAVLEICRTESFILSMNLYPFNPGHVMVFPQRHLEDYTQMTDEEAIDLHHLTSAVLKALSGEFSPSGFNIGCNLGKGSGASIAHIHRHIVPRYENEIGFLDVLAGTRVVVVDPVDAMRRIKERLAAGGIGKKS
jgi:ATP adenylyltransferase